MRLNLYFTVSCLLAYTSSVGNTTVAALKLDRHSFKDGDMFGDFMCGDDGPSELDRQVRCDNILGDIKLNN